VRAGRGLLSAAVLSAAVAGAGCGESQPPPVYAAINGYLNSLAAGNYASACGLLDSPARASLERSARSGGSCARALARCLPTRVQTLKQDQTQLLYANLDVSVHGSRASAAVGGTPVARAVRRVSLTRQGGRWKLTSYGERLTRCRGVTKKRR
jgi:hypothetical protein